MKTTAKVKFSGVFNALDRLPHPEKKKIIILRGGTRAGKTYSVMQKICIWLLTGYWSQNFTLMSGKVDIMRKFRQTLKDSAYQDFKAILDTLPAAAVKENKGELNYIFEGVHNGQAFKREVWFRGLDDPHKVRGPSRDFGFINEADGIDFKEEFQQVLWRTKYFLVLDFNPSSPEIWIKKELEDKRALKEKDVLTIVATHEDNPFIPEGLRREILAIEDPDLRRVYRFGEYGLVKGLVFPKIKIVSKLPEGFRYMAKGVGIGLDFGFTNDPTAAVIGGQIGNSIYLRCVLYEHNLYTKDIFEALQGYDLPIIADSSDPKTIAELRRLGLRIKGAKKGPDSIRNGIALLRSYQICITADSDPLIAEQKLYKYPKQAKKKENPIDKHNHCWDAVRYWAQYYLKKSSGIVLNK